MPGRPFSPFFTREYTEKGGKSSLNREMQIGKAEKLCYNGAVNEQSVKIFTTEESFCCKRPEPLFSRGTAERMNGE